MKWQTQVISLLKNDVNDFYVVFAGKSEYKNTDSE